MRLARKGQEHEKNARAFFEVCGSFHHVLGILTDLLIRGV
jgi:hypothetical protein